MVVTKVILASSSIGRKQLLEKLGIPFLVIPSKIDEDKITDTNPFLMLQKRSRAKAEQVAMQLTKNQELRTKNYLILAGDSMAVLGNKAFGKAKNKKHAKEILTDLMGKTHTFATATSIIHLKYPKSLMKLRIIDRWEALTKTRVTLRKLSISELNHYASRYDLTRFAAGYTLNETPWDLVTKIDGSYTNVIGLPFEVLLPILSSLKII